MRFSFAKWSALATAASSLVVEAESSSSESSSSSIFTLCPWWWWAAARPSGLSAGDDPRWLPLTAPNASAERMPASDVTTLASVLRSAFQPKAVQRRRIDQSLEADWFVINSRFRRLPGDETFCPEAERAALAADERSPRSRKLADVKSWDDGDSDFLSPAGFRSDCTAGRWESTQ